MGTMLSDDLAMSIRRLASELQVAPRAVRKAVNSDLEFKSTMLLLTRKFAVISNHADPQSLFSQIRRYYSGCCIKLLKSHIHILAESFVDVKGD